MESNKVHIVCSGGGMRCISYIGAIQKLYENNVSIASVSGCSMGTILAALICTGMDIKKIEESILKFNFSILKTKRKWFYPFTLLKYPYASHHTPDYEQIMIELIGEDIPLGKMKIPFSAAALDMRQRRFLVYSSETHPEMKISEVVRIATAIPFFYGPYKLDNRLFVDASIASVSPIWMAANKPGYYPILVLKVAVNPSEIYVNGFGSFLANLFNSTSASHDYFAMSQTQRAIEFSINCENIGYYDFKISKEQMENLILQGQTTAEQKLREYNNNFNHILDIEETKSPATEKNQESKAEALANQMITSYKNEAIKRNHIFVSYCRTNKDWLLKFQTALKSVERYTGIKTWDDTSIKPGEEWNKQIEDALISTKMAIFLVTNDFFASDFIQEKEMKYFLEISEKENVPILWVSISHSLYEITPLKNIQCANDPKRPLDSLSESEQNKELTEICKSIILKMKGQLAI